MIATPQTASHPLVTKLPHDAGRQRAANNYKHRLISCIAVIIIIWPWPTTRPIVLLLLAYITRLL